MIELAIASSALAEKVKVVSVEGDVEVTLPGIKPQKPKVDMLIEEGTKIETREASSIEIAFNAEATNIVKVEENSSVVVKLEGDEKIELIDGELFVLLKDLEEGSTFKVRTPCAVSGARGTGWWVKAASEFTDVSVFDNKVFVQGINKDGSLMKKEYWVDKGYERKINRFQKPGKRRRVSAKRLKRMEKSIRMKEARMGKKRATREAKKAAMIAKRKNAKEEKVKRKRERRRRPKPRPCRSSRY